ncbi:hypothetical protein [Acetobacter persici]|uniref:hypothetical protein n=1 Tax=Acetobacter persici TaxID=1076596 RepID=UPI001FCAEA41|nr:hypothetical protein [Acetobacter persici]
MPPWGKGAPVARHRDHGPVQGGSEALDVSSHRSVSRGADNAVSKAVMEQFTPGTSVLKAADRLPGVSFSSTDPLGIDLWGPAFTCAASLWTSLASRWMGFR